MAEFYRCISSDRTARAIVHKVDHGGGVFDDERYVAVRLGATWPGEKTQGAYVVVAQPEQDQLDALSPPLILLDENVYPGLSLEAFFAKVTDAYSLMSADTLYVDIQNESVYLALLDYLSRYHLNYVNVLDAPYRKDFFAGISVCSDWLNAGKLDLRKESMTRDELRSISREDLGQEPQSRFPLANALRFIISGYRKYEATPSLEIKMHRFNNQHGWML